MLTKIDGSLSWPEWSDECVCGASLPDACEGDCPECGDPYWHLIAQVCASCGGYIGHDDDYLLDMDGGDVYHLWCHER